MLNLKYDVTFEELFKDITNRTNRDVYVDEDLFISKFKELPFDNDWYALLILKDGMYLGEWQDDSHGCPRMYKFSTKKIEQAELNGFIKRLKDSIKERENQLIKSKAILETLKESLQ